MNKPDTLSNQLKSLEEAGFLDVDCYFKNGIFVVFGGKNDIAQNISSKMNVSQ
jgi:hypothetical protein